MILASLSGLIEQLNWLTVLSAGVWAGLVAFTLGLSFLLWTRWGYYHLMGKCVLFSLLAHVVFGLFLATAEVVEDVVVALNAAAKESPITIERVQLINSPEVASDESKLDGRSDELPAIGVWDRPSGVVSIGDPSMQREAPELSQLPAPVRESAPKGEPLPKQTPRPAIPVAVAEPDDPRVTKPTPEAPDRTDTNTSPDETVAAVQEPKKDIVPESSPARTAEKFGTGPAADTKLKDPRSPARAEPESGTPGPRVTPRIQVADADNSPSLPVRPLLSGPRSQANSGRESDSSLLTAPLTTPELSKDASTLRSRTGGSAAAEPSSSVRLGLPTNETGNGKDPGGPQRASEPSGDGLPLPPPKIASSGKVTPLTGESHLPSASRPIGSIPLGTAAADRQGTRLGTPEIYRDRTSPNRSEQAVKRGGSSASEEAVARALEWLATHQQPNGSWDLDGYQNQCPAGNKCSGTGSQNRDDCAVTGLVLLTFLGAGNTHMNGAYSTHVERGIDWLLAQEKSNGDLRGTGRMYSQGIATLALSEALGMTSDPKLRDPVARAVQFIVAAQNQSTGGWRYLPGQYGDTSIFGWQLMALKSAALAGVSVPEPTWQKARVWLTLVGSGRHGGLACYVPGEPATPAMTAEALACRVFLGDSTESPTLREAADYLMQNIPRPIPTNPHHGFSGLYYWYYGTVASFQMGGTHWQRWNASLRDMLIEQQVREGHATGSWDPVRNTDPWCAEGGRVYCTAMATLCLEVYYRFLPLQSVSTQGTPQRPQPTPRPDRPIEAPKIGRSP